MELCFSVFSIDKIICSVCFIGSAAKNFLEYSCNMMTDPIADLFTRIRNGLMVRHPRVDIPGSKMKKRIMEILKEEGYIKNFRHYEDGRQGIIRVYLKYQSIVLIFLKQ